MKTISILLFSFALACSNNSSNDYPVSESKVLEADYGITNDSKNLEEFVLTEKSSSQVQQEQKVIKTGRLAFQSNDLTETHNRILGLADQYKGFIQSDNSGKNYNRLYTSMVIRVPSENFQAFINAVSEGVSYFDQKEITRQDVSEEFVDLEARLKAKHELEKRYLELLKQAKNVKEMLEIERELSKIREEIEAKQGRLQFLENRVSMSTVNIDFYTLTAETGVTKSYGQKIVNSLKGGWDGVSVFFLGLLYIWPLFILILIAIFVLRKLLKRNKKKPV
jgi:hypothetical protein